MRKCKYMRTRILSTKALKARLVLKKSYDDKNLYKIFYDVNLQITFLPCRHVLAREKCAKNIIQCSIYRKFVKTTLRVYII